VVMDVWVELPVAGVMLIWALCLRSYQPKFVAASGRLPMSTPSTDIGGAPTKTRAK
jgi:hypothetical protein